MRSGPLAVATIFLSASTFAGEIREFDVPTVERLGRELYERDEIAAKGTDLVLERYPKSKKEWLGWVTEPTESGDRLYVVTDGESGLMQGYVAMFPKSGESSVHDRRSDPLPEHLKRRFKARLTAIAAAKPKMFSKVDNYNVEVLDDPDGSGFLVYCLAYIKPDEIVLGGHIRVTVSADGEKAEQVDAFSNTLVTSPPPPKGAKKGEKPFIVSMSQAVSNMPLETCVYISFHHNVIASVGTMDGLVWMFVRDKIYMMDSKGDAHKVATAEDVKQLREQVKARRDTGEPVEKAQTEEKK